MQIIHQPQIEIQTIAWQSCIKMVDVGPDKGTFGIDLIPKEKENERGSLHSIQRGRKENLKIASRIYP